MASVAAADALRMEGSLFLDGRSRVAKTSRFWVLLLLSAVIATAGVASDSTATVIGAMIVAPLMTPILGMALALVLADRRRLLASTLLVVAGTATVVGVGFAFGLLAPLDLVVDDNTQIAGRVHPRLIDLLAALATGSVGAFALVRSDVSDALPGVAIAISLVPPLSVAGLVLENGSMADAAGAMLLFGTNVTAIVATGTLVFLIYPVREAARAAEIPVGRLRGRRLAVVGAAVLALFVPLGYGSYTVLLDRWAAFTATEPAAEWAAQVDAAVLDVSVVDRTIRVTALAPTVDVDLDGLRRQLDAAGLSEFPVEVDVALGRQVELRPGDRRTTPGP